MVYIQILIYKDNKEQMLNIVNNLKIMKKILNIQYTIEDYWKIDDTLNISISGNLISEIHTHEIEELFSDIDEYIKIDGVNSVCYVGTKSEFNRDSINFAELSIDRSTK